MFEREGLRVGVVEARTSISEVPDTGKEEQATPRRPEAAVEGGQVRFDDESPNWELVGKTFMTFLPSCKTVELLCGPEDVLMLFRSTEKSPENPIFPSTALRVSRVAFSYTENSSFPYRPLLGTIFAAVISCERQIKINLFVRYGHGATIFLGKRFAIVTDDDAA